MVLWQWKNRTGTYLKRSSSQFLPCPGWITPITYIWSNQLLETCSGSNSSLKCFFPPWYLGAFTQCLSLCPLLFATVEVHHYFIGVDLENNCAFPLCSSFLQPWNHHAQPSLNSSVSFGISSRQACPAFLSYNCFLALACCLCFPNKPVCNFIFKMISWATWALPSTGWSKSTCMTC